MEKKEFIFKLPEGEPLKYAHDGSELDATFITLLAPSYKDIEKTSFLKQCFFRAMNELEGSSEGDQPSGADEMPDGEQIMSMLLISSVEVIKVIVAGEGLLTSGLAMVEGEEKLTVPLFRALNEYVSEAMIGEYLANFILVSVLSKMKEK